MNKAITPEVLPPGRLISFAGAPEWLTPDMQARIIRAMEVHTECSRRFRSGAVKAVVCGVELLAAEHACAKVWTKEKLNPWPKPWKLNLVSVDPQLGVPKAESILILRIPESKEFLRDGMQQLSHY
jgi:hypothetical protein